MADPRFRFPCWSWLWAKIAALQGPSKPFCLTILASWSGAAPAGPAWVVDDPAQILRGARAARTDG